MTAYSPLLAGENVSLGDVVDRLLHKGVVINGDAMVSLAGVDLVYLRLSLLLTSVQRLTEEGHLPHGAFPRRGDPPGRPAPAGRSTLAGGPAPEAEGARYAPLRLKAQETVAATQAADISEGGANEARDLGRLVLTLVDILRRVLERQALRRMEGDSLSEEETERMGLALMELDARMTELCEAFGLRRDELDIDLGPLGKIDA